MDPSTLIAFIPEPWRTYVLATLFAVVAAQMAASLIVALLPAWTFVHPVYGRYARGLATFGHFKPSDAPGTLKAPLSALDPRALAELERVAAQAQRVVDFTRRPPSNGQSGRAHLGALVVLLVVGLGAGAVTNGCDPIREGVMRITPGVPSPSPCVPDSQRCAGAVPEVCSQSSMGNTRWWPSLSLRADGTQRVCSNGCVVDDAGVAGCAPPIPPNPFADASVTSEGGAL